ncbi:type IV pilin N-terminal domain-containing protein [Halolamina sediminis]|uniref:type IV pilin N-terminal domain-containing protein n=1 Tax=Halolamina sediminis TaxID=1480675 RepID=UPI000B02BF87|nr:type IV pilin [Halolamina sediminis]
MPRDPHERAISPVIGAVLLFAVVIMLTATAGVMVLGFSDSLRAPPPFAATDEEVEVEVQGNETRHTLDVVHRGGDPVEAAALTTRIAVGDRAISLPATESDDGALADGEWSVGERLTLGLNESLLCAGDAEEASVALSYRDDGASYELSSQTVPIERGQFVIDGAEVRATAPYTANVKFVGTGWSSETADAPVNVTVSVGGTVENAWRMVEDSDSVVGATGVSRQEPGTDLEVTAAGRKPEYDCVWGNFGCTQVGWQWTRVSSTDNTENVRVYRDGDDAPEFGGADGQQSAAAYVEPYLEDGEISLDDNQAIYLFDFNEDSHDYQDAVVLVSFFTQAERSGIYESRGEDVVICPPETKSASPNGNDGNDGNGGNGGNGND